MMAPGLSVLLPVHNGGVTVARAMDSIRAQTFKDWELLVINDRSTDETASVVADACAADRRIRLLHTESCGLVSALNRGLAEARAPLIARMDADDWAHPDRLARQCAYLDAHPEIGLVSCRVRHVGGEGGYRQYVDWTNTLLTPEAIRLARFIESPFAHPSVCFRRVWAETLGDYREGSFPEDYEMWLRWLEGGVRMAKLPEVLLDWYDSGGRLSRTDPRYDPEKIYRIKGDYLCRWLRRTCSPETGIWLWGSGRITRRRFRALESLGEQFRGYVDIDQAKVGGRAADRCVIHVDAIPVPGKAFFVLGVGNRGARRRIEDSLRERRYAAGRDYIAAA